MAVGSKKILDWPGSAGGGVGVRLEPPARPLMEARKSPAKKLIN
jgi:hypothetical protein